MVPDDAGTVAAWLKHVDGVHPDDWDLTLDRVALVADRLQVRRAAPLTFLVAGTNGKGSTCTYIDALLRASGLTTGLTTSPHFSRFNERFQLNGREATDAELVAAFAAIEEARADVTLTQFEFGALIALWLFREAALQACVLEIGLGGRFDAMNVAECDVTVITRVALDHTQWLGNDRETIGAEKAGILRAGVPVVLGDNNPPASVTRTAAHLEAPLFATGQAFGCEAQEVWLSGQAGERRIAGLPDRLLPDASFAAAVQAVAVAGHLPDDATVRDLAARVSMPGRFERRSGRPGIILDVAHNPDAAQLLARRLASESAAEPIHAVFNCYSDKDVGGIVTPLLPLVSRWFVPALPDARANEPAAVVDELERAGAQFPALGCANVLEAMAAARAGAGCVIVFGSFATLAAVYRVLA